VDQSLEAYVRIVRFVFLVIVSIPFLTVSFAQQTSSSSAQAVKFLQQALVALSPGTPTTDVTLSGNAQYINGSDDETGAVTVKAVGADSSIVLALPSGTRSEVRLTSNGQPSGTWTGTDGISHKMPLHNLLTEPAWFFPLFAVSHGLMQSGYVATYVGQETRGDVSVQHLSISQIFSGVPVGQLSRLQPLSQIEIYLDSTTFLPNAVTFTIHPDNNELLDIPIEIFYSDYRVTNGVQVPFHVQRFLNNGLVLDLQFQNAALNSGLTASQFATQ
jgi:hypothetical protein